jgi:hypothetical protein
MQMEVNKQEAAREAGVTHPDRRKNGAEAVLHRTRSHAIHWDDGGPQ